MYEENTEVVPSLKAGKKKKEKRSECGGWGFIIYCAD